MKSNSTQTGIAARVVQRALSLIGPKTEPRFVVLGTGRSGSGYISQVLTASGIKCGHESWWNPHGRRQRGLVGDSSWCALALIDWKKYTGQVFHQVRHPLDVISSYVYRQSFTSPFAKIKLPLLAVDPGGDPLRYGCRIWLDLNRRSAELTDFRWQVERVDSALVRRIGEAVGVAPRNVQAAIEVVSKAYNSHGTQRRLPWNRLPRDLVDEIESLAHDYGYAMDDRSVQVPGATLAQQPSLRRSA
jgi:hypothetical protein